MTQVTKIDNLDPKIQALCRSSLSAREHSYSPYSKFKVGATLQCPDGSMVSGCNVENASYGLAICAERTAVVKAVSTGVTDFLSVAIAADLKTEFVGPCGMCRQTLAEFNPDMTIYLVRLDGMVQVTNLNILLPGAFSPKRLTLEFHNGNTKVEK
eukprot:TRINITY_DN3735_c0_g1_i1.p1 TRINITY_DN3735_c0_g1~~TRINITY_DN3735_c0_g1_i1.p1  ORF type:complete len:155 (-),score=30.78 TRINITY_DN3735_c0_g1_i1:39-503(-)